MLSAAKEERLEALYLLAIHTGLRQGDLLGLKWSDIDLDAGTLSVQCSLDADPGYDYTRCRRFLRARGIRSRIARRGLESSERLGGHRWVVERTFA
jgi:hypothetical protein